MAKNLKLGEILKQSGIIDDFQLNSALSYQRHWGGRFGESLIKLGYISETKLQNFLAKQFDLPQVDLHGRKIPEDVLATIPLDKARELHVLPVERMEVSGTVYLVVAMTDPTNLIVTDSLQFMTGCRIRAALASEEAITAAIERNYGAELVDEDDEFDIKLEELSVPVEPEPVKEPEPVPEPEPEAVKQEATPGEPDLTLKALKKLEDRFENLLTVLLDRGVIDHKDLDELM